MAIVDLKKMKKMKNKRSFRSLKSLGAVAAMAITFLFAGCDNEEELVDFNFQCNIEQIGAEKSAKVHLVSERWIYWDMYDEISIGSNLSTESTKGTLINAAGDYSEYNGVFFSSMDWHSEYFLGLFPYNAANVIKGKGPGNSDFETPQIVLPQEQPYTSDITFARTVFPMVAWYGGTWASAPYTPFNLDFHSLAGLVRLQFFNSSDAKTVSEVQVTSKDGRQLWGTFNVKDYKTYDPHVEPTVADGESNPHKTLRLTCDGGVEFGNDTILSFYLVVPALANMNTSTTHNLTVKIMANDGTSCSRDVIVNVRRNGITYMRALGIEDWALSGPGASDAGLVGNGTAERPYKIYSPEELTYMRQAFETTPVVINNKTVTGDTYFRIMRSNIELSNSNWTGGIKNFKGHLDYYGTNSTRAVIVNNSSAPLFHSISAEGEVNGIVMTRTNSGLRNADGMNISAFCLTNNGTIRNCEMQGVYNAKTNSNTYGLAGICVDNHGTIEGSGCTAEMSCTYGVASGVCLNNYDNGTITGCYASSTINITNSVHASGICNNNQGGTIKDCYFAASITGATIPWAGIVYASSSGGTVKHCYLSESATIESASSVGGIVHTLGNTTVDYCWCEGAIRGTVIGTIAAIVNNGGVVKNSFCNAPLKAITVAASSSVHYGGGLVGQLNMGGQLLNSYAHIYHMINRDEGGVLGGLIGNTTGGTVDNCYVYETTTTSRNIYGSGSGATFSNCHIVGGTEEPPSGVDNVGTTSSALSTLKEALDSRASAQGYRRWVMSATVPVLDTYTE